MIYDTAGDPMGEDLHWTHRTTEKISDHFAQAGIAVSPNTVGRLLKTQGYALRVNHKKKCTVSNPDRNAQFEYIQHMRQQFEDTHQPILSVDSKKKEMIGDFKSAGSAWSKEPIRVNDHDFKRDAKGFARPHGVYDVTGNRGFVCVGVSHDTAAFAVDSIVRYWKDEGSLQYPGAAHLLFLSDSGGSNNYRHWGWKHNLQIKLCNPFDLTVTVCHYPPGASKWDPIEHRLFGEISKNLRGRPVDSYETLLHYIATTKTKTGLVVNSCLLDGDYPLKQRPTKEQIADINIERHCVFPLWNYTLRPTHKKREESPAKECGG